MKWEPISKAGRLKYDQEVLCYSQSEGIFIGKLSEKITSSAGTRLSFAGKETETGPALVWDVSFFCTITNPVKPKTDEKKTEQTPA